MGLFNRFRRKTIQPLTPPTESPQKPVFEVAPPPMSFVGYGLPRNHGDSETRRHRGKGFELFDAPFRMRGSINDFDGAVFYAGAFEAWWVPPDFEHLVHADLDTRELQTINALHDGKPIIFLVNDMDDQHDDLDGSRRRSDLFKRIAMRLDIPWYSFGQANPVTDVLTPEFQEYCRQCGTGKILYGIDTVPPNATVLCSTGNSITGITVADQIFFLPAKRPLNGLETQTMVTLAVEAVVAYRKRLANVPPPWLTAFQLHGETLLQKQANDLRTQLQTVEAKMDHYDRFKNALRLQDDPLVEVIGDIFAHFFDINLTLKLGEKDENREDALWYGSSNEVRALVEIKGVNRHIQQKDVDQIDNHRIRSGFSNDMPAILVVNHSIKAMTLEEKCKAPHPDIIKKAVNDNVLVMSTVDLLNIASGVEHGTFAKEKVQELLLNSTGWLTVAGEKLYVRKK